MFQRIKNKLRNIRYKLVISSNSVESRFTNIYKHNIWFRNKESRSGAGSTLSATKNLRTELPKILLDVNAKNLTDIGCGDFHWMKEIKLPCPYVGIDIVKSVIEENIQKYASDQITFLHLDSSVEPLPPDADIVLCREVLFHLSFEHGLNLLNNILSSNARYLLITSDASISLNKDIKSGSFRNLNLTLPPFNFLKSDFFIKDDAISSNRVIGVWDIKAIKNDKK